jgi:hypothetical protein
MARRNAVLGWPWEVVRALLSWGRTRCEPSRSGGCRQSGALLLFCRNRPLLRNGNP